MPLVPRRVWRARPIDRSGATCRPALAITGVAFFGLGNVVRARSSGPITCVAFGASLLWWAAILWRVGCLRTQRIVRDSGALVRGGRPRSGRPRDSGSRAAPRPPSVLVDASAGCGGRGWRCSLRRSRRRRNAPRCRAAGRRRRRTRRRNPPVRSLRVGSRLRRQAAGAGGRAMGNSSASAGRAVSSVTRPPSSGLVTERPFVGGADHHQGGVGGERMHERGGGFGPRVGDVAVEEQHHLARGLAHASPQRGALAATERRDHACAGRARLRSRCRRSIRRRRPRHSALGTHRAGRSGQRPATVVCLVARRDDDRHRFRHELSLTALRPVSAMVGTLGVTYPERLRVRAR